MKSWNSLSRLAKVQTTFICSEKFGILLRHVRETWRVVRSAFFTFKEKNFQQRGDIHNVARCNIPRQFACLSAVKREIFGSETATMLNRSSATSYTIPIMGSHARGQYIIRRIKASNCSAFATVWNRSI